MRMKKRIYSVLVENRSGVLGKVAGLFARRCFNIESLVVGETDDPENGGGNENTDSGEDVSSDSQIENGESSDVNAAPNE